METACANRKQFRDTVKFAATALCGIAIIVITWKLVLWQPRHISPGEQISTLACFGAYSFACLITGSVLFVIFGWWCIDHPNHEAKIRAFFGGIKTIVGVISAISIVALGIFGILSLSLHVLLVIAVLLLLTGL